MVVTAAKAALAMRPILTILIPVCVLAVVILQNRSPVQAHCLSITVEMPVILLLLLTAGLGFALGLLAAIFHNSVGKAPKQ